jgi:hypothetical protein
MNNKLLSSTGLLNTNVDGWYTQNSQAIPLSFIDQLKDQRLQSTMRREGEYMKVASIPVVIIEKWQSEGFDINKKTAKEIVARLKAEDLDDFLATEKRL